MHLIFCTYQILINARINKHRDEFTKILKIIIFICISYIFINTYAYNLIFLYVYLSWTDIDRYNFIICTDSRIFPKFISIEWQNENRFCRKIFFRAVWYLFKFHTNSTQNKFTFSYFIKWLICPLRKCKIINSNVIYILIHFV